MLDHHIQKQIIHTLSQKTFSRFAELRPRSVESNAFSYHLKRLIKDGLVQRNSDGTYELTSSGQFATVHIGHDPLEVLALAYSVLMLAIRDQDNNWLLRPRPKPPFKDKIGFMHTDSLPTTSAAETAAQRFRDELGRRLDFQVRGSGFVKIFSGDELKSYIHFTLMLATVKHFEPLEPQWQWYSEKQLRSADMMPNVVDLTQLILKPDKLFYTELEYRLP